MATKPETTGSTPHFEPIRELAGDSKSLGATAFWKLDADARAQMSTTPSDLITRGSTGYPGFANLTGPSGWEPFQPSNGASTDPIIRATGRISTSQITHTVHTELGGNKQASETLVILDEHYMPGWVAMEKNHQNAVRNGTVHPDSFRVRDYSNINPLTGEPARVARDRFYFCTPIPNKSGEKIEWGIRGQVEVKPLNVEAGYLYGKTDHEKGTLDYDPYMFLRYALEDAAERNRSDSKSDKSRIAGQIFDLSRGRKAKVDEGEAITTALSRAYLDPDYLLEDKANSLTAEVRKKSGEWFRNSLETNYFTSSIAYGFIRAARQLEEVQFYKKKEMMTDSGERALLNLRREILGSLAFMVAYLEEVVGEAPEFLDVAKRNRALMQSRGVHIGSDLISTDTAVPLRFEAVALDPSHLSLVPAVTEALRRRIVHDAHDHTLDNVSEALIKHSTAPPFTQLLIKALGGNELIVHDNTSLGDHGTTATKSFAYSGKGISHEGNTYYGFEMGPSLINPRMGSLRFPNGLIFPGAVTEFDIRVPERDAPSPPRCLVLSERNMTAGLKAAIDSVIESANPGELRRAFGDNFGVVDHMDRTHIQAYVPVIVHGEGVTVAARSIVNGQSYALAIDGNNNVHEDFGKIDGQKPVQRSLTGPSKSKHVPNPPLPKYTKGTIPIGLPINTNTGMRPLVEYRVVNNTFQVSGPSAGGNIVNGTTVAVDITNRIDNKKLRKR